MRNARAGRRPIAAAVGAVALSTVLVACGGLSLPSPTPVPTDGRPNIVFVLTDDLSTNLLPYLPHVQALEQSGTSLTNFFVVDSLCCPSRAAIFTGLYPHDDGVYRNTGRDGGYRVYNRYGNPKRSFAVALHQAGYYTGFMGKYLNLYQPNDPPAQGWDIWDVGGKAYPEYNYDLNENGSLRAYGHEPQDYLTTVLDEKAVQFVDHAQYTGKPFALEVATFAPHQPATPAPADARSFPTINAPRTPAFGTKPAGAPQWLARLGPLTSADGERIDAAFRRRVESMQAVDRLIGHLERALAAIGQLDNTYLVFGSDNGYHMGDYGLMPGKQTAFDTDIRVPLVVSGPGVPAGQTVDAIASNIDLAPTFQDIAQAPPVAEQDGVSLLPLLRTGTASPDWQQAVLVEHHGPVRADSDPDIQPVRSGNPPSYEAMRTRSALYVEYATGEHEYYDLRVDPYELDNVYGSLSPAEQRKLHNMLFALVSCHGTSSCQRAASPAGL